jgi:ketosteroid isomerase-like protein
MNAMTKTAKLFSAALAFAVVSTVALAADPAAEVAAIHAVDQTWLKSYNSGDVATLAALYDEQAVLLPPGSPRQVGREAIRGFFTKDMAASAKAEINFGLGANPDGGVSGNMGWASGTYVVKDKAGKVLDTGKYLSVSAKKDGKWLYVRDTWNSDGAPPPAEGTASPKK